MKACERCRHVPVIGPLTTKQTREFEACDCICHSTWKLVRREP